jgi:tartrate dehydrogenase/decarboxylase / D-malate dehydrogenase
MRGVPCPLAGRQPGDIDFVVVRENTEGDLERVLENPVDTAAREDGLAASRPRKHLTSATKSNGIALTMPYWDERFRAMAERYPEIRTDQYHSDILTAHFVRNPHWFDVVVGSNLFGDILSDLGPGCTGTITVAPSANPTANSLRCSSPCTARPRTSTERASPTRGRHLGRRDDA